MLLLGANTCLRKTKKQLILLPAALWFGPFSPQLLTHCSPTPALVACPTLGPCPTLPVSLTARARRWDLCRKSRYLSACGLPARGTGPSHSPAGRTGQAAQVPICRQGVAHSRPIYVTGRLSGGKRAPLITPGTAARLSFQPPGLPCTRNALTDARHPAWPAPRRWRGILYLGGRGPRRPLRGERARPHSDASPQGGLGWRGWRRSRLPHPSLR